LVLVFDAPGKTFRHEIYRDYKSHRPEAPVDLIPQFALVRQAARAYGICQVEAPGFEADDVIATLCRMARDEGLDVNIFSGDKDLMQLVCDRQAAAEGGGAVQMIDPATMARCTSENVIEKWGVPPSQLGDVLALAGDAADNVPGACERASAAVFFFSIWMGSIFKLCDPRLVIRSKFRFPFRSFRCQAFPGSAPRSRHS
jgi:DNA polymerase-1